MVPFDVWRELATKTPSKIVLVVVDGLGGLPDASGRTELEAAHTPNLDALAARSSLGATVGVAAGISPGSGPGHLALFGYDPIRYVVGRGALSALGVGFDLGPDDVALRMNFATLDEAGNVIDRRAGRIPTETNRRLVEKLRTIRLPSAQVFVETEREYRAVLVLRGEGLSDRVTDTDPQRTGVPPLPVRPETPEAQRTADLLNQFVAKARELLRGEHPANGVLLRGAAKRPHLPTFGELYRLTPAAIAVYPMYRGLARLVGMEVLQTGESMADEVQTLRQHWDRFDFFFVHFKPADSAGEDGDFARKARVLEEIDRLVPEVLALRPDVFALGGDHATPSTYRSHSWHPVPFLLHSPWVLPEGTPGFSERAAVRGVLGRFPAIEIMGLLLAHAQKLTRYGA